MSLYRRNPRTDANQQSIINALRAANVLVMPLSAKGVPDLLCACRGTLFLVEVKRPAGPKGGTAGRNLTPAQVLFHAKWKEYIFVVTSAQEAIDVVNGVSRVVELEG